jgi:hypothetical protein
MPQGCAGAATRLLLWQQRYALSAATPAVATVGSILGAGCHFHRMQARGRHATISAHRPAMICHFMLRMSSEIQVLKLTRDACMHIGLSSEIFGMSFHNDFWNIQVFKTRAFPTSCAIFRIVILSKWYLWSVARKFADVIIGDTDVMLQYVLVPATGRQDGRVPR